MMSKMSYEHTPLKSPLDGRVIHQLLDSKAEEEPDTEAMVFYDMNMRRSSLTYAEYRNRSMYLAASLIELGVSHGQYVLLIGSTSLQYALFIMAFHRIGVKAIMLGPGGLAPDKVKLLKKLDVRMIAYDPEMKESQTKQLMTGIQALVQHNVDTKKEPQIIVTLRDRVNQVLDNIECQENDSLPRHCQTSGLHKVQGGQSAQELNSFSSYRYEDLLKRGQSQELDKLQEAQAKVQFDDPTIATFTSGSTGDPKAVQHTMHSCMNVFEGTSITSKGTPRIILYMDRPFCWMGGYMYGLTCLCGNATVVVVPTEMTLSESTNEMVFKIWEEEKCSLCPLSAILIHKLLKDSMSLKYDLSQIKVFILGSQHFSFQSVKAIFALLPAVRILLGYGSTESCKLASELMDKDSAVEGIYGKMAVSPGVEVKIVDDENKIVPRGAQGEICTRNSTVFLEYVNNPEATRKTKSPTGWLYTGDIGIMTDQGKIEVLGRKSQIIKRLSVKIFPAEIEKVIQQHPYVAHALVVGIPDQQLNEIICACVILHQDSKHGSRDEKANLQELEDWCLEQWPPGPDGLSLKPKYFLPMKKFPVLVSGKTFVRGVKAEAMKILGVLEHD